MSRYQSQRKMRQPLFNKSKKLQNRNSLSRNRKSNKLQLSKQRKSARSVGKRKVRLQGQKTNLTTMKSSYCKPWSRRTRSTTKHRERRSRKKLRGGTSHGTSMGRAKKTQNSASTGTVSCVILQCDSKQKKNIMRTCNLITTVKSSSKISTKRPNESVYASLTYLRKSRRTTQSATPLIISAVLAPLFAKSQHHLRSGSSIQSCLTTFPCISVSSVSERYQRSW